MAGSILEGGGYGYPHTVEPTVEIADSYEDAETHFQIAARNALDLVPQFRRETIQWIGLAPNGIISAMFPILSFNDTRPLGTR